MSIDLKKFVLSPWTHIILLMVLTLILVLVTNITQFDDGRVYQKFVERLSQGQVDLSIPGFHGIDFLSLPIFWLTHSELTPYIIDIILGLFTIPLCYLLGKELFKSNRAGIFLSYAYVLMPLEWTNMFRGGHQTAFIFFFILGLYLLIKGSFWSWLVMGFSYIIKPYAIFACPFFVYKKKYKEFFLSLIIPLIYLIFQVNQAGKIIIGVHQDMTPESFFNVKRFILNLIYAVQNIFSVHNFSPFSNVYLMDMSHISVILVALAIIAIFCYKKYFNDKKLFFIILTTSIFGLVIPCAFEYLDMWRIIVFYFMVIILSLPVLDKYKFFVPVTVGISGFQFLYSYFAYQSVFWPSGNKFLFVIWGLIFIISLGYYFITYKKYVCQ